MKPLITQTFKIYSDNEIIHLLIHDGANLNYNEAKEMDAVTRIFGQNKKDLKLFDARGSFTMETEAKQFFQSPKVKIKMTALAVLIGPNTRQPIIDLCSDMNSKKLPTRFFVNYDEAVKWLNAFKK